MIKSQPEDNTCDEQMIQIKYKKLRITYKNITKYYVCNTMVWNWWLNRYYPKAELILEVEHLN